MSLFSETATLSATTQYMQVQIGHAPNFQFGLTGDRMI